MYVYVCVCHALIIIILHDIKNILKELWYFSKICNIFKTHRLLMEWSRKIKESRTTEVVKYQVGFTSLPRNILIAWLALFSFMPSYLYSNKPICFHHFIRIIVRNRLNKLWVYCFKKVNYFNATNIKTSFLIQEKLLNISILITFQV